MGKQSDTSTMQHTSRKGSVQAEFVHARDIAHNVLCLGSLSNSTQREYRAILEVSATNYTLTSEEEQELIVAGYRAFLKSLAFPLQILVRSQQLDLRPYVQSLLETSTATTTHDATWRELALSHAQYVRELAARRTLLEHRFYSKWPRKPPSFMRGMNGRSLWAGWVVGKRKGYVDRIRCL